MQPSEVVELCTMPETELSRMIRWGVALLVALAVVMFACGLIWPEPYQHGWLLALELLSVGRAVCMYEGIRLGFSGIYLLVQGTVQDVAMTFLVLPWIVRFYRHASRNRLLGKVFGAVTRAAEMHQKRLRGFGLVGLFLFVFFPVAGTGTMVGSIVGFLLGYRLRDVLPVVITGHILSLIVLYQLFDWLEPLLRNWNEGFAQYFGWLAFAVIALAGWLFSVLRSRLSGEIETGAGPIGPGEVDVVMEPAE